MLNISKDYLKVFTAETDNERQLLSSVIFGKDFNDLKDEFDIVFKKVLILDDQSLILNMNRQSFDEYRQFLNVTVQRYNVDTDIVKLLKFTSGVECNDLHIPGFSVNQIIDISKVSPAYRFVALQMTIRLYDSDVSDGFVEKLEEKMRKQFDVGRH